MGAFQTALQYEQKEEKSKDKIHINIDQLTRKNIAEGTKYELNQIKEFKIDQTKVINGYLRECKSKYKSLFSDDLIKLIKCFYVSNCYEFFGSGILNKFMENTDDDVFNSNSNFVKLSRFSNLCMDIKQFQYRKDHILILTATNNILSIQNHNDDNTIYQHLNYDDEINQIESIIINKEANARSFIYCMKKRLLYGLGYNTYTSFWKNVNSSSFVSFNGLSKMFQSLDVNIKDIVCGGKHSLFLTQNEEIYSFGRNDEHQCGFDQDDNVKIPRKIHINAKIIAIAAGSLHSICLDDDNNLWCFGSNSWGQCGIGNFQYNTIPIKNKFYKNIEIEKIICGNRTSIIIDNKHQCYISGENTNDAYGGYGQCGHPIQQNICIPNLIQNLLVNKASNSYNHTMLLTVDNKVYSMGNNKYLQCSTFSKDVNNFYKPYYLSKQEIGIADYATIESVIAITDASIIITK